MKIISGLYKGRKIEGFDIDGTRPTMERVKESLFATIQDKIKDSVVLDLFSGSGNLGFEALSQGASYAYLVDNNYKAAKVIRNNMETIGIKNCEIINQDYQRAVKIIAEKSKKIDIIFLDPPYATDFIEKSIIAITKQKILADDGIIVCESDKYDKIVYPEEYQIVKEKKYGDKWVVILKQIC